MAVTVVLGLAACARAPVAPIDGRESSQLGSGSGTRNEGAGFEIDASVDPASRDEGPWFEEVHALAGIDFRHQSGADGRFLMPEMMVGGLGLFDMEGDGDLDLYLVQSGGVDTPLEARPGNRLYRNDGGWRFVDVSEDSGADDRGYGSGVAIGDYDEDGDPDLYVTNLEANVLLRNDGEGRFTDVSAEAGVADPSWSSSAAFLDYDLDGDLDLFVVNFIEWHLEAEIDCLGASGMPDYCGPTSYNAPARDRLYRNDGGGRFTDVSIEAGLSSRFGNGLGVVVGDFDDDLDPDLFVANDGMPDQLWINDGSGGLVDRAGPMGVAVDESGQPKAGMGTLAADLDRDGDEDLMVVNLSGETDSVFTNQGDYFSDASRSLGLGGVSRGFTRFGIGLQDFDNDGRLELYLANGRVKWQGDGPDPKDPYAEPNLLLRLEEQGFEELGPRGGTRERLLATSRGAAFGDIDGDGRVDLVVANRDAAPHLLRNIRPSVGRWLGLQVVESSGRDALGARVTVTAGAQRFARTVRSAYSYCSANDPRIHLGLGEIEAVDAIEVRWQDGAVEHFEPPIDLDRWLRLQRGAGRSSS